MSSISMEHDWFPRPMPENVEIGTGSWLYSAFAFLHFQSRRPAAVRTGRSCGIYNGCFFELGPCGEVEIGDFSTLVGVIVSTDGMVHIGRYCFLAHEVVIADHFAATPQLDAGRSTCASVAGGECVRIDDDAWIGARAILLKGARIGRGAIVGAGAVVDFDVPPLAVVAGNPARIVGYTQSVKD